MIIGYIDMDKIYIGDGIMAQIKEPYYITKTITKKELFEDMIKLYKDFYKEYPYATELDYEKFCRDILRYYD